VTRIPRGASILKWRRQRQAKSRRHPVLNLIALMDVFTILVLFFLVHSSYDTAESRTRLVRLPESSADTPLQDTPAITITGDTILLGSTPVASVEAAMRAASGSVEDLYTALHERRPPATGSPASGELTINGDRDIPFDLLYKVMRTCSRAGFDQISLAVIQRPTGGG